MGFSLNHILFFHMPRTAGDSIQKSILNISEKKTVVFISHRLSNFIQCDQILFLHDGTIVESGDHNELISLKGRYKALFNQRGQVG